jgi:hypothetical protein
MPVPARVPAFRRAVLVSRAGAADARRRTAWELSGNAGGRANTVAIACLLSCGPPPRAAPGIPSGSLTFRRRSHPFIPDIGLVTIG